MTTMDRPDLSTTLLDLLTTVYLAVACPCLFLSDETE